MKKHAGSWVLRIGVCLGFALGGALLVPTMREGLLRLFRVPIRDSKHSHQAKTLSEWVEQLNSPTLDEQHAACYAIQYFGSDEAVVAVPALIVLLQSKEPRLRAGAAYALGRIGLSAQKALLPLAELLTDEQDDIRANAAEALDYMSDPQARAIVPALNRALEAAIRKALQTSTKLAAKEEIARNIRRHITRALGKIGPEAKIAVLNLTELLRDDYSDVRAAAAEALGLIGPGAKTAVPALTEALDRREGSERLEAALALWRIDRSDKAVPVLLGLFKDDKDTQVRVEAAGALGKIGEPAKAAVPVLREAAQNDPTRGVNGRFEIRMAAAEALKQIDPEAAKLLEQ